MQRPQFPRQNQPNSNNNNMNFAEGFRDFVNGFQGNPEEPVKQLLASGQMTQQTYNMLYQKYFEYQGMIQKLFQKF